MKPDLRLKMQNHGTHSCSHLDSQSLWHSRAHSETLPDSHTTSRSPSSVSFPPPAQFRAPPRIHPLYHGIRQRSWGKWVSEIRHPHKKTRIWLGSFSTPEMAARAHDVAAMSLKGASAQLNFPEFASSLTMPASLCTRDIQTAAAAAAAAWRSRELSCAKSIVRGNSGEEQGRIIEREEELQQVNYCDADGSYSACEAMERGAQCEQVNEERHSPVPSTSSQCEQGNEERHSSVPYSTGSQCEQGEQFSDSISSTRAGDEFFDEELRYVFADMAEAMLIPPPLPPPFPLPLTGSSSAIVDEEGKDDSNWDFWLWNQ